jgi:hypothetical protein
VCRDGAEEEMDKYEKEYQRASADFRAAQGEGRAQ